jgi:hypothetical protein
VQASKDSEQTLSEQHLMDHFLEGTLPGRALASIRRVPFCRLTTELFTLPLAYAEECVWNTIANTVMICSQLALLCLAGSRCYPE